MADQPLLLEAAMKAALVAANIVALDNASTRHDLAEAFFAQNRANCRSSIRHLDERIDEMRRLMDEGREKRWIQDQILVLNSNKHRLEKLSRLDLPENMASRNQQRGGRIGRGGRGGRNARGRVPS